METKYTKTIKLLFIPAILFAVFFVFSGKASAATTYYVSPTGSDNNSGLIGAPFKTIQKAANVVNPGDTVIVADGTYTDNNYDCVVYNTRGGTSSNWITFKSENKWGAVLDGQNNTIGWGLNFVIFKK